MSLMIVALGTLLSFGKSLCKYFDVKESMLSGHVKVLVKLVSRQFGILTGNDPFGVLVSFWICSFCI